MVFDLTHLIQENILPILPNIFCSSTLNLAPNYAAVISQYIFFSIQVINRVGKKGMFSHKQIKGLTACKAHTYWHHPVIGMDLKAAQYAL